MLRVRVAGLLGLLVLAAGCSSGREGRFHPQTIGGVKLVAAPEAVRRQCQVTADWLGYATPCPGLLPQGSRPSHVQCGAVDWSKFITPGCDIWYRWALGDIQFPTRGGRTGHLVIQASPKPGRDPTRFIDAFGWSPEAPALVTLGTLDVNGWRARSVDAERAQSSSQHHTVLMWTTGGHTYGIAFHGRDATTAKLNVAVARSVTLVPPRHRHAAPLEPARSPGARLPRVDGPARRTVSGVRLDVVPPVVRRQCKAVAYWLGFPVACPRLLPHGSRPRAVTCLGTDWSRFVINGCARWHEWSLGQIEFPVGGRTAQLALVSTPGGLSPARRLDGLAGYTVVFLTPAQVSGYAHAVGVRGAGLREAALARAIADSSVLVSP